MLLTSITPHKRVRIGINNELSMGDRGMNENQKTSVLSLSRCWFFILSIYNMVASAPAYSQPARTHARMHSAMQRTTRR